MIATPPPPARVPVKDLTEEQRARAMAALGILTPEQKLERDRWLAARWFVIRNVPSDESGGYGEALRCIGTTFRGRVIRRGCGQVHDCITWCCLTRPFNGHQAALFYLGAITRDDRPSRLIPSVPLLVKGHPRTARELARTDEAESLFGHAIGRVEPITAQKAREYTLAIQTWHPAFDPAL